MSADGTPVVASWQAPGLTRAGRVIAFCESLPVTKGILAGSTMRLLPGQRDFIEAIYGRAARVRIGVKSEPRGNGKTGLVSALALCHLAGPEAEVRGEIYSASIDRSMASLIFNEMVATILAVPALAERINIQRFHKRLEVMHGEGAGSTYEALSADARRGHGLAPSLWIYDELAQATSDELLNNLQTAMGKRTRSLGLVISTQADTDTHPLSQLIDDGLSGLDPSIVVHLTAADVGADPFDTEVIRACNPALGIFLNETDVLAEAERARRVPAFAAAFRNRRLNQRVAAEGAWLSIDAWDACADEEPIILRNRRAYLGLDLASRRDLTALAIWLPNDDGTWDLRIEAWVPHDTVAERERADRVPYRQWIEAGWLNETPGNSTDYGFIEQRIYALMNDLEIAEVAVDPWNARDLNTRLLANGVPVVEVPQNMASLSAPSKTFETWILSGKIRHERSPLMRWSVGNVVAVVDVNENLRPDKRRSRDKIDPVSAAINGLARALAASVSMPMVTVL